MHYNYPLYDINSDSMTVSKTLSTQSAAQTQLLPLLADLQCIAVGVIYIDINQILHQPEELS